MSKRNKKLLSLLLSTMMVFSVVPSTVYAAPEQGTEATVEQDANEEVKQEDTVNNEADASVDQTDTKQDETKADDTAQKNDETVTQTGNEAKSVEDNTITVSDTDITMPVIQFKGANAALAEALTKDVKIDENDPAIKGLRKELESITITDSDTETADETSAIATYADDSESNETKRPMTEEEIQTVLGMYQQYQQQWKDNANVLGVQNPFFLDFNDKGEDGLGILGEMLALAGETVDHVRDGSYKYDDLTGMIINFMYGDKLGVEYYGKAVTDARDEVLQAVSDSNAGTRAQQLLVINDWLAHHNTFDMAYIMNSDKKDGEKPMIASEKQDENYRHHKDVYDVLAQVYRPQIEKSFHDETYNKIKEQFLPVFYENAIQNLLVQNGKSEDEAKAYVEERKEEIDKDPEAFVAENFPEAADTLKQQADSKIEEMTQQQLESDDLAVDMDGDNQADVSLKQAIDIYTDTAATKMTTGVTNYWEGSQFGALGFGTSVCLGYSKAFSYFVQCLDKKTYLKDENVSFDHKTTRTNADGTTDQICDNWKTADDLYYKDGELNTDAGYTVDLVRISFQSSVTMFGETQDEFASDHYWNAVKIDKEWYYVDPCYTDVYTEVMSRDRVETDGDMNHAFFLFSQTSTKKLYKGNYTEIRSLYTDKAKDQSYEKAWMARAASNVYSDGKYMYYLYDSTDLFSRADKMTNSSTNTDTSSESTKYKLVRHAITNSDGTDADNDYETLIDFTAEDSGSKDTCVKVLQGKELKKDDTLTKLYAQFVDEQNIYPSIGLTASYYEGKIYFNVSNAVISYDLKSGEVVKVKEYNSVSAVRDKKNLFGGMAFTTVQDEGSVDFTVKNHPIAGLTIKEDGTMYVSIATNFAFISGKDSMTDQKHYGYAYEETDYNPGYTNYKQLATIMGNPTNDNDEFMWSANFVDKVTMSKLTGNSHSYELVSVPATCGRDAFTEMRCKEADCGLIQADSRETEKNTAHEHHYIEFHETYYTTSNGKNNTGVNYVCPECGACATKPVKSNYEQANTNYEKREKLYEEAKENAAEGHDYTATDAEISEDHSQITFQNLRCDSCYAQKNKLDCLLESDTNETNIANYNSIEKTLAEKVSAPVDSDKTAVSGDCQDENGASVIYVAAGKTDDGVRYTAKVEVAGKKGEHQYTGKVEWKEKKDADGKGTGEYEATVTDVKCTVCGNTPKEDQITVVSEKDTENSVAATCETDGKDVWKATVTVKSEDGSKVIGSFTDTKKVTIDKLGHKYGKPEWTWADDHKSATATFTCANDSNHVETKEAKVEEKSEGATCTKGGKVTYTATVEFNGEKYEEPYTTEVDALGHEYGDPTWKWSKDDEGDGWTATATFECKRGDDKETEVATVSISDASKDATCTEEGNTTYTAKINFNGKEYSSSDQGKDKVVPIPAKGHAYDEPTFNWTKGDNNTYTATASRVCKNDASHVDTVNAKVEEKSEGASCTEAGKVTYTATAKFEDGTERTDTKVEEGTALGHDYKVSEKDGWKWTADKENGYTAKATFVCSRCKDSHEVEAEVTKEENDGQVTYTAKATYKDESGKEFTATAEKKTKLSIYYEVHREDYGWEVDTKDEADLSKWKSDGMDSGTVGECKRLEAIKIKLPDGVSGSVQYRTHIQDIGWESKWAEDGALSGTSGKAKRLEAIQIKLSGKVADNYDIYYCVHAQNVGWLGWAKNGEQAGTAGYAYRLEAIKIKLVPKGEKAPEKVGSTDKAMEARLVGYQTHVQDIGTQDYVYDGAMAGTSGQAKRMESIRIKLPSTMASEGKIEYKSHIENIGWENSWKQTGKLSGTSGKSLRLEAIQIKLSGDIADKYDVYYRVHAENFGWLGWAKNGEKSGTEGYAYRLEALQIKLVPKGTENPELPTPASAKKEAFIKK